MISDRRARNNEHAERYRDRDRTRPAPYPSDKATGSRPGGKRHPPFNRVFVSNIPYDEKWQKIKDLFRDEVGDVTYVELMLDNAGNSKGFGIVEFGSKELAQEAIRKMQGYNINDRRLVVKEDFDGTVLQKALRFKSQGNQNTPREQHFNSKNIPSLVNLPDIPPPMPRRPPNLADKHEDYRPHRSSEDIGRKVQEITRGAPFGDTIFVANLDYKVSYSKLKEVFRLAGNVVKVIMHLDQDNSPRGMASITFETPLEAVQAISMFNKQLLYDRPMMVKMDRENSKTTKELPRGLQGIGPSLNLDVLSSGTASIRDHSQNRIDTRDRITELEMLTAKKKLLESGLNENLRRYSEISSYQSNSNLSEIPGLRRPAGQSSRDSLGLSSLRHESLSSELSFRRGIDYDSDEAISSRIVSDSLRKRTSDIHDTAFDNVSYRSSLGDGSHLLSKQSIPEFGLTDRDRIEMDIARVDSRIRDLDRSLKSAETKKSTALSAQVADLCSVVVSNLPFGLTWQKLKRMFARVGYVRFADIKNNHGIVQFNSADEALLAMRHFDGADLEGHQIRVRLG